jgi:hypothetical protein
MPPAGGATARPSRSMRVAFTTIEFPGATSTGPEEEIVGSYIADGLTHGVVVNSSTAGLL